MKRLAGTYVGQGSRSEIILQLRDGGKGFLVSQHLNIADPNRHPYSRDWECNDQTLWLHGKDIEGERKTVERKYTLANGELRFSEPFYDGTVLVLKRVEVYP